MLALPRADRAPRGRSGDPARAGRRASADGLIVDAGTAARLRAARRWFVLTGAGISAESGIPTFRGAGGLWEGFRAEDLASPEGFRRDPERVWRWYRWRRETVARAVPNAGHRALAALERHVGVLTLATQNVDDLHERGGSRSPLHLHGRIMVSRCLADCGRDTQEDSDAPAPRCGCGAFLRPDVVWFGEMLPTDLFEAAADAAGACEVCLVVGTSGIVHPAAGLPRVARHAGAVLIEVNPEETAISSDCDRCLRGPAAEMLPRLLQELGFSGEPARDRGV